MEDDREKIFAAIRRGLRGAEKVNAARDPGSPYETAVSSDFDSLFEKFRSELVLLGGKAYNSASEADAARILADELRNEDSVFVYDEVKAQRRVFTETVTKSRRSSFGQDFPSGYDKNDVAGFDAAIATCAAAIAETGTVVMSPEMRLPAALVSKLFVIVDQDRLIPSLDELFVSRSPDFRGSNTFLITGPSRTADIEKQLVRGVHGPKDVIVIFLKHQVRG